MRDVDIRRLHPPRLVFVTYEEVEGVLTGDDVEQAAAGASGTKEFLPETLLSAPSSVTDAVAGSVVVRIPVAEVR